MLVTTATAMSYDFDFGEFIITISSFSEAYGHGDGQQGVDFFLSSFTGGAVLRAYLQRPHHGNDSHSSQQMTQDLSLSDALLTLSTAFSYGINKSPL